MSADDKQGGFTDFSGLSSALAQSQKANKERDTTFDDAIEALNGFSVTEEGREKHEKAKNDGKKRQ